MSTFPNFKQSKVDDTWNLPAKGYFAIKYTGSSDEEIILMFLDGILYAKRLTLNYPIEELKVAKEEFENLQEYIESKNMVVIKSKNKLFNQAYGSQIAEDVSCSLTNSTKGFKSKSAIFSGKLDFLYGVEQSSAKINGYCLQYESIDLSKTKLDAKTGYSLY